MASKILLRTLKSLIFHFFTFFTFFTFKKFLILEKKELARIRSLVVHMLKNKKVKTDAEEPFNGDF